MYDNTKKSQNPKTLNLYNNILSSWSVFTTNNTPHGVIKHHKTTKPETCQMTRIGFLLPLPPPPSPPPPIIW